MAPPVDTRHRAPQTTATTGSDGEGAVAEVTPTASGSRSGATSTSSSAGGSTGFERTGSRTVTTAPPPTTTADVALLPPTPGQGVMTTPTSGATGQGSGSIDNVFDYAEGVGRRPAAERPGWWGAVVRGTEIQPVFGQGSNWFTRGMSDAGNWVLKEIGKAGSSQLHQTFSGGVNVPITDDLVLGFTASGRKVREDEIMIGDPRRLGIEELRQQHAGAVPLWIEGTLGQKLSFNLGHTIPIGATGANVSFGFAAEEGLGMRMERLAYFPTRGKDIPDAAAQIARLALDPASSADMLKMETGANYRFFGHANLRVSAALGLGASVPALSDALRVGANVELGGYASLSGDFSVGVQKLEAGRARMTLSACGSAGAGTELKAFAGVEVNRDEVARVMRGFVDYVGRGGDPTAFKEQLGSEHDREVAASASGYMVLLAKNVAEGAGCAVVDGLVQRYATAYVRARGGVEVSSSFTMNIDFELGSTATVELPRGDMVPASMRRGAPADKPIKVCVGDLAKLAYDMAMKGDLRLVQQLSEIRGAGVRIGEQSTVQTTGTSSEISLGLPFIEYRRAAASSNTVTDRYTPELGRTRTSLYSFNRDYASIFGDTEQSSAEVRVHTPDGKKDAQVFFGSDDNFSADFVVQNKAEKATNFEEMQDLVAVLNTISGDRLESRVREALASGPYRKDSFWDDINPIHQFFFKPREYGKTVANLHVWLGEAGIRELLESDLSEDQLYAAVGKVFAKLDPELASKDALPAWAKPGADRKIRLPRDTFNSSGVIDYGVAPMDHDLPTARYLVDNLTRLRKLVGDAKTPAQEEKAALAVRNFLRDSSDKLPAYAALASLVPEQHRAVEMRLTAIRKGGAPIRFSYIQDGRASDLLYATGFARTAMQQYQRYQSVLDLETRLRVGNLLGEMHAILNSPSPDPYKLKVTMQALEAELAIMDQQAAAMSERIEKDLGLGRVFLDGLPEVKTIQAVLPGPDGDALAALKLNATVAVNAAEPDLPLLRATFKNIFARMPQYRRIQAVAELVQSTAVLANDLQEKQPQLAKEALAVVTKLREAIAKDASNEELEAARQAVSAVHTKLLDAAGAKASAITEDVQPKVDGTQSQGTNANGLSAADLAEARTKQAESYRTLAGSAAVAPLSYFERTGVVPPFSQGSPYQSGGAGVVTAAMVSEADLAMATSRPPELLPLPPLSTENVAKLVGLAKGGDAASFLKEAQALSFQPAPVFEDPGKRVVEFLLCDIPASERRAFLNNFSVERRSKLERIFTELDLSANVEERKTDGYRRERARYLRENPRYDEDLRFIRGLMQSDPKQIETGLNTLGYGRMIDQWNRQASARLDQTLSQITGDQLNDLVGKMNKEQRQQFYDMLRYSDLKPQTRAKLAGAIVDDTLLFLKDDKLVEALVVGMNAAELRIFFDQLSVDEKLEDFLSHSSFWEFLLTILTLGLARLFLHDNQAALRVCAAQGWNVDELRAEYNGRRTFLSTVERDVEGVHFNGVIDTIPMDPQVRGGLRVVHSLLGNVKYYDFAQLPAEAGRVLVEVAKGAGKQLAKRVGDIAEQGGSLPEIVDEYKKFLSGLTPAAIQQQLNTPDVNGSAALIAKALSDGAIAGLIQAASDPRNKFLTMSTVAEVMRATNQLDKPIHAGQGSTDMRIDDATYRGLQEKGAFFKSYMGLDFGKMDLLIGGFATAAPAVSVGPTISIAADRVSRTADGKIIIDDYNQQVLTFHETVHTVQSMVYGMSANSLVDQGFYIASSGDRNGAYTVTEAQFDRLNSVHDLSQHAEQQAETVEAAMRLLWANQQRTGSTSPAVFEQYPGDGGTLRIGGASFPLTRERWDKLVRFVHEFGEAGKRAFGSTGGAFEWRQIK